MTHVPLRRTWVTFFMTVMNNVTHVRVSQTWVTFFRSYADQPRLAIAAATSSGRSVIT